MKNDKEKIKHAKKCIFFVVIMILFSSLFNSYGAVNNDDEVYVIGVLSFTSKEETKDKWHHLAEYLSREVKGRSYEILPLYYDEFEKAIESRCIDYVLTNPSHYIILDNHYDLSGVVATLIEMIDGHPQYGFGGVIFTRNESGTPKTIEALKGKTIGAVDQQSLGGYQASAYELIQSGLDLNKDVSFKLTGMPHCHVVKEVMAGTVDAGFVRTGILEKMLDQDDINLDEIYIINNRKGEKLNRYISTDVYPEWPFIALSHIDVNDAQHVAAALYLMESHPEYTKAIGIAGFTIPSNYKNIEFVMKTLQLEPFDQVNGLSLLLLWKRYWYQFLIMLFLVFLILFYGIKKRVVNIKLGIKNNELELLTSQLREVNDELREISEKDALTGVYNRRYFENYMKRQMSTPIKSRSLITVCVIDVDDFKFFNDNYGHQVGDAVLVEVAQALKNAVQLVNHRVGRFGGDEFIIGILTEDVLAYDELATSIIKHIEDIRIEELKEIKITVSMGMIYGSVEEIKSYDSLFQLADKALFNAKKNGKNGFDIVAYSDTSINLI